MPTNIEWTHFPGTRGETWNPITGCTPISPGCDHCFAKRMTERNLWGYDFTPGTFHLDRLDQPARWRKPRTIFVCSMADLWHPDVLPTYRSVIFQTVALAPQHRYLFLTKRPERIDSFPNRANCGLGVTVENSDYLWRIEKLLKIPAAMRFVSLEPLLGEVDLSPWLRRVETCPGCGYQARMYDTCPTCGDLPVVDVKADVDWIIAGGETGPGARPMDPAWARLLRDQCQAAGVPFMLKSRGEYLTLPEVEAGSLSIVDALNANTIGGGFVRVGKKKAGRLLDGVEWNEFPEWGEPQAAAKAAGGEEC